MFASSPAGRAFTVLSTSGDHLACRLLAAAWGAELHLSRTYFYALGRGYGHQASYLLGMLNYDIDIGDTSSFPIAGTPQYHFDWR
ncbi:MAG: hypothetical protein MZU97_27275 [Bacillus subtilis]|nr:hypothetical protein [Bacillus subtilis]